MMYAEEERTQGQGSNPNDASGGTVFGIDFLQLSTALSEVGNNWERVPLRSAEGRDGWEDALVGCLKDASPRLILPLDSL
jgi:hypothetical protein